MPNIPPFHHSIIPLVAYGKQHPSGVQSKPNPLSQDSSLPLANSSCSHFETRMPAGVSCPTPVNNLFYKHFIFLSQFFSAGVVMKEPHSIRKGHYRRNGRIYLDQVLCLLPRRQFSCEDDVVRVNHPKVRVARHIFTCEDIGSLEIGLVYTLLVQKRQVGGEVRNKGPFLVNLLLRQRRREVLRTRPLE